MDHLVASTGQRSPAASFGLAPKRATLLFATNRIFVWVITLLIGVWLAEFTQTAAAQVTVTTLAGTAGVSGSADGSGAAAKFFNPIGIAADAAGNLYVTNIGNGTGTTIRKITAAGMVSTLAGTAGVFGSADGSGAAAQFGEAYGIAADTAGNLYVADTGNNTIRKITAAGVVSTLAGIAGARGSADGSGAAAQFSIPYGIAADAAGNLYVADTGNHTIRKITAAGVVSTLAGTAGVWGSADGSGAAARFLFPIGITTDSAGNLYVADHGNGNNTIRKITGAGLVSTLAGSAGVLASGPFPHPTGITTDTAGNLYVAAGNHTIRKITAAGVVSTLAGIAGVSGSADNSGAAAQFYIPYGIAADAAGNLYVADSGNSTIRKITQSSVPLVPIIANLIPNSGPVGAPLFIQGSSFGTQQNTSTVSVCGVSPAITRWSDTLIALAVPNFPAGTVCNVRVWTNQGEATSAQYTITRLTSVSGRVLDQSGDPLGGVTVVMTGPTSKIITTASNGRYLVDGISSGEYTAGLFKTGYLFSPSPKTLSVGGVIDVLDLNFVGSAILPALTNINPKNQKDVAKPVILTGTGFGSLDLKSKVEFGGVEAPRIHSWTPTSIEVEPPYLSASVLVQVKTSAGESNFLAFQYLTKNLDVAFSLENPVDGFFNGAYLLKSTVSTVPGSPNTEFTVTKDISVTNTTQTWYVLYVQKSGVVEGGSVGSAGELIGPGETLSIGRLTFQKNSSVRVYVDRDAFHVFPSVCRRNGFNCGTHALKIQTAQAVEMFWRMTVGSPIPVTDEAKLLFGAGIQADVAWLDLANVVFKSTQGDLTALFALPDALIQIVSSPAVIAILASYGYLITPSQVVALAIYRGSLVVKDLIQTLRAPHNGAIAFEAK